ncbi:hypothetical protein JZ751_001129 [Albula glossodonta]|uniref:Uncharacterized protein n=1 Tax=Albula glossodonta TaxID=121402 RepID=A0A8T2PSU4_9TELE|nr:hypothetical protein JZ751_001129 [Albula glossodonta]
MFPGFQNTGVNVSRTENCNSMAARCGASFQGAMDESTYATEMNFDVPAKRSTNLEMLSEELERQTRETQKLQEQVEHATKRTMERMGHTLGGVIPQALTDFKFQSMDILQEVKVPEVISSVQDLGIQPVMCNEMGALRGKMSLCLPGNDVVDEYSQQVSELQQQLSAVSQTTAFWSLL